MKLIALAAGALLIGGGMVLVKQPAGRTRVAGYVTTLQGRTANQRHNARLALSKLVGFELKPGATFSFNRRVGTWTRDLGYRRAPVSYNGTLIDAWGGGVCQTSTTVYNAGLLAGLEVVERHAHRFAPTYVPPGRDAAVAFSNIDLKLRNPYSFPLRLRGEIQGDDLRIWWEASGSDAERMTPATVLTDVRSHSLPKEYEMERPATGAERSVVVRNAGKGGWEVATYRRFGGRRELVSVDSYPAMDRIVEIR